MFKVRAIPCLARTAYVVDPSGKMRGMSIDERGNGDAHAACQAPAARERVLSCATVGHA
jgi:hypothetical protein